MISEYILTMFLKRIGKLKFVYQLKRLCATDAKLVSLTVDEKTGYSILRMQRPPVNSLNLDLLAEISSALEKCEKNSCPGLILTSKFDGVFSAGLDIFEMYKPDLDRARKFWSTLQDTWIKLYGSSYPTVALINGHAPAGGCLFSCSTDYRIMYKDFKIGANEAQLGLFAPSWFIDSFMRITGFRQSESAMLMARMFTADEALRIYLIDDIAEHKDDGMSKAVEVLKKFSTIPSRNRAQMKLNIRGEFIDKLVKEKEEDTQIFLTELQDPQVQKNIGLYLETMRNKRASKP